MNKTIRCLLVTASIAAVGRASPFMAVGDGAELFATGVVGVRADDNIFLTQQKESATIIDFAPGVELDFGKNSQMQGSFTLADTWSRYLDHGNLNTNLVSSDFITNYDDGKLKLGFNAGYHELNQNTADVRSTNGRLVRRDIFTVGTNGEVGVSEITSVAAGFNFEHEKYHPTGYVSSDTTTVPVNFYYKYTPKLDLSLGYQFRDYTAKSGGAPDSTDHFFNVGARGEFSPKLTGKIAFGFTERRFSGSLGNRNLPGLDASLAYEITPKSTLQFGATNQFDTSPQGFQQKNFTINALATTRLSEEWSINGGVSYRRIGYYGAGILNPDRNDNYWEGTLGTSYTISANLKVVGNWIYRSYRSDALSSSDFDNNVFSIAADIRY